MTTMNDIDLMCQEVQESLLLLADGEPLPESVAVEMTLQLTYRDLPVAAWPVAVPYMVRWTYEHIELRHATRH